MLENFLNNQILVLLSIVLIGFAIGRINIFGISLGSSACLFVAICAGMIGAKLSPIITDLGIVFFVYSIGLQAGPHFFRLLKLRGLKFSILGIFAVLVGSATTILIAMPLKIDPSVALGAFAGALTSTPTLASGIHSLELYIKDASGLASLGYAVTYPFGMISLVLFVQLIPKIFAKTIKKDSEQEAIETKKHGFHTRNFRLTNANLVGKTIKELGLHSLCKVNVSRIRKGDTEQLCFPNTKLELGDIAVAVGTHNELEKFMVIFGEEVKEQLPLTSGTEIRNIFVSGSKIIGKPLKDLKLREVFGITITRIYKGDIAITPTGNMALDVGDSIRAVGTKEGLEKFVSIAGSEKRKLDDTNILILALGMFVGVIIGSIPLNIAGINFNLGIAGGPLIVALILSHFGKIWKWSIRMPNATKFFIRDIGLVFFFTGVGINSGSKILVTIADQNIWAIFLLGAAISIITMILAFLFAYKVLRIPMLPSLGAMCGALTSSPALGALVKTVEDDTPVISYAAVYPVAVILLTVFGQVISFAAITFLTP